MLLIIALLIGCVKVKFPQSEELYEETSTTSQTSVSTTKAENRLEDFAEETLESEQTEDPHQDDTTKEEHTDLSANTDEKETEPSEVIEDSLETSPVPTVGEVKDDNEYEEQQEETEEDTFDDSNVF